MERAKIPSTGVIWADDLGGVSRNAEAPFFVRFMAAHCLVLRVFFLLPDGHLSASL